MELLGLIVPFLAAGGWLWWIYHADRFEREPWGLVLKTFGFGAASGVVGLIAQIIVLLVLPEEIAFMGMIVLVPVHLAGIALMLYAAAYRRPEWNEPFDGVVYGGAVGIGYGLTNTLLEFVAGLSVGFRMAMFSIPIYMLAGLVIGHHMSRARFGPQGKGAGALVKGFAVAALYLAGLELARALGGQVLGRDNALASAIVYGANTLGWVMAMSAMDARRRSAQSRLAAAKHLPLDENGCPRCSESSPVGAAFCSQCGEAFAMGKEAQA